MTYLEEQQTAGKQGNAKVIIELILAASGPEHVTLPFMLEQPPEPRASMSPHENAKSLQRVFAFQISHASHRGGSKIRASTLKSLLEPSPALRVTSPC